MKRLSARIGRPLLVASIAAGLWSGAGCDDDVAPPPPPPGQTAPTEATPPPTPPGLAGEDEEDYVRPEYPEANRRNPFRPDPDVVQPPTVTESRDRQLDPLEQFGVGQLELVAIISEIAIPKAMFLDPDGFGHVVKEGDRVGRNGATIADIRNNEVELIEAPDAEEGGQGTTRIVKLSTRQLQPEEGLTEEDRKALERLLQSEEGMRALRETARKEIGREGEQGTAPPTRQRNTQDPRFRGFAPPTQGEE